jgi:nucleotide-binding universal stress UspA family protein
VIERAAALAGPLGAEIAVLSIARVWGSAFGFPNPGLMPSRRELEEQRGYVAEAVRRLRGRGFAVEGRVLGTRSPTSRIVQEAARRRCEAIVMAADPPRGWLLGELSWANEPYRVRRRARVPVHLVVGG